jgi:hypothetical protein
MDYFHFHPPPIVEQTTGTVHAGSIKSKAKAQMQPPTQQCAKGAGWRQAHRKLY